MNLKPVENRFWIIQYSFPMNILKPIIKKLINGTWASFNQNAKMIQNKEYAKMAYQNGNDNTNFYRRI